MSFIEEDNSISKQKTDKIEKSIETMIKHTSLDEPS